MDWAPRKAYPDPTMATPEVGKTLVFVGLAIACAGAVVWSGFGRSWLGRLPGDIHARWGHTEVFLPLGTCVLLSAVLTLLSWLLRSRR
jgi:hypothetical protein